MLARVPTAPTTPTTGPPASSPSEFARLLMEMMVALTPGFRPRLSYVRYMG
jgi:hypothetical protein